MVIYGVPLYTVVGNLGQANDGYRSVGGTNKVLSQGFTTGSAEDEYALLGIGVNIEGSGGNVPDSSASVSVAVHADSGGKPGAKLFDLLSPTEFAAGHNFFEAPRGTTLEASTSYVMVWTHLSGTAHRMRKTSSNAEDTGARTGFSIANTFYQGADINNMSADSMSDVLEIVVYSEAPRNATGRPVILPTAEDAGVLAADTSGIADPDGLVNVGALDSTGILHHYSYKWIRVDGEAETVVGTDSNRYRRVDADIGKLIKVEASFTDAAGVLETVTSLPFGPLPEPDGPQGPVTTLVGNTGQTPADTAVITARYFMGFKLGSHGQGYEISGVSIDLAAVPSSLGVSLWMGNPPGPFSTGARTKLFDFENPDDPLKVGLNEFKAPAGAFAYQNVEYFIALSDFGASLSIKETTSDDEDSVGESGAELADTAGGDTNVLRLAVKGSKRARGVLTSTYGQEQDAQEIVSLGDEIGFKITLGGTDVDRYLIRGVTFGMDDTTPAKGGFTNPWDLQSGTDTLVRMVSTRQIPGVNEFSAHQGATVPASSTDYKLFSDAKSVNRMGGVILAATDAPPPPRRTCRRRPAWPSAPVQTTTSIATR